MAKRRRGAEDTTCRDSIDRISFIRCRDSIDRISLLPDELLVHILSLLTLKEAAATSILSCQWRYLWTFIPKLDFDGLESIMKVWIGGNRESLLDEERLKYIEWVNEGTKSHEASTIEEFRVYFNLNKTHKREIDQWLTYALARKVKKLELNLTYNGSRNFPDYSQFYSFPDELLRTDDQNFSSCSIGFKYLKNMSIHFVNVNGEALEFFLHNCPLLEQLSVNESGDLSSLRIIAPLPSFKRLEIKFCCNLTSVEISNANLVYLNYWGRKIHFLLDNVPLLAEICLGGNVTMRMEDVLSLFPSCLPQLEIFTLDSFGSLSWEETTMFYSAVKMSNLKQLTVKGVRLYYSHSLLPLTNLISASPCLQRFVVQPRRNNQILKFKVPKIVRSYPSLREVEFLGYRGVSPELELINHFLENAVALEKIIIDPRKPPFILLLDIKEKETTVREEIAARDRAKQLINKLPPRISLEIL